MVFRILFAIIAYYNFYINHIIMKIAFFYRFIDQLIYIQIPRDLELFANKNIVCKLLKILYGVKQASRLWYKRLSKFLLGKLSLPQIKIDHNLFLFAIWINALIVSTFVNDIKIIGVKDFKVISREKEKLIATFGMVDMEPIGLYLGLKISQDRKKKMFKLFQPMYII